MIPIAKLSPLWPSPSSSKSPISMPLPEPSSLMNVFEVPLPPMPTIFEFVRTAVLLAQNPRRTLSSAKLSRVRLSTVSVTTMQP